MVATAVMLHSAEFIQYITPPLSSEADALDWWWEYGATLPAAANTDWPGSYIDSQVAWMSVYMNEMPASLSLFITEYKMTMFGYGK